MYYEWQFGATPWFVANNLTLNVQKTNYIQFHLLQRRVNFEGKLSLRSLEIDRVKEYVSWYYD